MLTRPVPFLRGWQGGFTVQYLELFKDLRIFGDELLVLTRDGVEGEEQALDLGELELGVRDLARVHNLGRWGQVFLFINTNLR